MVSAGNKAKRLSSVNYITKTIQFNIVFNLSRKVLIDIEIKVLKKELDFAPKQNKTNEPELRADFEEFARRMRTKWHFRNEPTRFSSVSPAFRPKST